MFLKDGPLYKKIKATIFLFKNEYYIRKLSLKSTPMLESDKHIIFSMAPVHAVVKWNEHIYDAHHNHWLSCLKEVLNTYTISDKTAYDNAMCYQFISKENSKWID